MKNTATRAIAAAITLALFGSATPALASSTEDAQETPVPRLVVEKPKRLALEGLLFGGLATGIAFAALDSEPGATLVLSGIGAGVGVLTGAAFKRSPGPVEARVGERIRSIGADSVEGTLLSVTRDHVAIQLASGEERLVPLDASRLEVRRGTRLTKVGAVTGFLTLGSLAGLVSAALCEVDPCTGDALAAVAVGGAAGAGIGAVTGALVKLHDWRALHPTRATSEAALNERRKIRVSMAPTRDKGVRAQVTINWR